MTTTAETVAAERFPHHRPDRRETAGPLAGLRVLDLGTVYAAPITAMLLGDWGADVIKVEHPRGDPARTHGLSKDGHGLWWKVIARNKRTITLNFSTPDGQDILRRLVEQADVVIENFRPGVMEKWGLGPERIAEGQPGAGDAAGHRVRPAGPYATRRAFGTLAEAMSGLAHQTGEEAGPPTLPPFGLADGVAGLTGAYAVMLALYHRDVAAGGGQVIDLSLLEPLVGILGPGPSVYDQLGVDRRPARQPVDEQRPAQRLPDQRRPVGGDLGQCHLGGGTGDAPGRTARHRRTVLVPAGRRAGQARGHDRCPGGGVDRARDRWRRCPRRSRPPAPRWRRSTTSSS